MNFCQKIEVYLIFRSLIFNKKLLMNTKWDNIKEYSDIKFEFYNGVAKITINRPKVYNAFRPETNDANA